MAKKVKTEKKLTCENIAKVEGDNIIVKPTCPRKVAVGNEFISTKARCISCEKRKEPTTPEIEPEIATDGDLSKGE